MTQLSSTSFKKKVGTLMNGGTMTAFMSLLTFWALFGDDIRLSSTSLETDNYFEAISIFVLVCFTLEIIACSYSDPKYLNLLLFSSDKSLTLKQRLTFGSFYFWLDLLSTVSLLLELSLLNSSGGTADDTTESARAGRASRAGAKAGKIIKLVRMTRLIRTIKLYKYISNSKKKKNEGSIKRKDSTNTTNISTKRNMNMKAHPLLSIKNKPTPNNSNHSTPRNSNLQHCLPDSFFQESVGEESKMAVPGDGIDNCDPDTVDIYEHSADFDQRDKDLGKKQMIENQKCLENKIEMPTDSVQEEEEESNVGSAMTDITTRRVIVLVLLMLLAIPFLMVSESDDTPKYATALISQFLQRKSSTASLSSSSSSSDNFGLMSALDLAIDNCGALDIKDTSTGKVLYNDARRLSGLRAVEVQVIEHGHIIAVYDVLDASRDEAIMSSYLTLFVMMLLSVGTYALSVDINRLVILPIEKMVSLVKKISANPLGGHYHSVSVEDGFDEGMETTLLMQTINKIGRLMTVGFGEAGTDVIAQCLAGNDDNPMAGGVGTGSLKLNFMRGGVVIQSIFGFCDVRQFTDTTECLQEEVMLFVNRIAHILHTTVVKCDGHANKNIGDAFLLTWKIDSKQKHKCDKEQKEQNRYEQQQEPGLADKALYAMLRSLISLHQNQQYICNFSHKAIERLYRRFPSYAVKLGCGLHVGSAVEGAIGSHRKIDVSYLSPAVNFSEFLESSTKSYGVPLLMSEPFYDMLSPIAKQYCRQVDRISVKACQHTLPATIINDTHSSNYSTNSEVENPLPPIPPSTATIINGSNCSGEDELETMALYTSDLRLDNITLPYTPDSSYPSTPLSLPSVSPAQLEAGTASGSINMDMNMNSKEARRSSRSDERRRSSRRLSSAAQLALFNDLQKHHNTINSESSGRTGTHASRNGSVNYIHAPTIINSVSGKRNSHIMKALSKLGVDDIKETIDIYVHAMSHAMWEEDLQLVQAQSEYRDPKFKILWEEVMHHYESKDWIKAKIASLAVIKMMGDDGPAKFILETIDSNCTTG